MIVPFTSIAIFVLVETIKFSILMKNHIEITIQQPSSDNNDLLIAELTFLRFNGFLEEDTLLKAYIPEADFDNNELNLLLSNLNLSCTSSIIKEQNWNEVWESNFTPVSIDDFVGIRAFFHEPMLGFEHELLITPKMSFGTGHHATTFSVIQLMRTLNFKGKNVLDFGTGTGVLAILAEKLGAKHVLAIDNDTWCIDNASENILVNNCKLIEIQEVNVINSHWKFDAVIANINRHIIEENLQSLSLIVKKGGDLILSGLLSSDETDIVNLSTVAGFAQVKTLQKDGWIAIHLIKQ